MSLYFDMLNNFCFHVFAQKSLSHTLSQLSLSHSLSLGMLNNFCFQAYPQKSLFIAKNCNDLYSPVPSSVTSMSRAL